MDFKNKTILITGINNKKSIAYHVAQYLNTMGASLVISTQFDEQYSFAKLNFENAHIYKCDVSKTSDIISFKKFLTDKKISLDGFVHSIAFARMSPEWKFEDTPWEAFSEAIRISSYSLMELCSIFKELFNPECSIVTLSISTTKVTSYGYMGPIKSLLNSTIDYLAQSFSSEKNIRFNSVGAGPLKTSASAGIPGYVDNYLFSEQLTLRKKSLTTQEVANTVLFLLSKLSSGINASQITVDAGMSVNYFDKDVVKAYAGNRT